MNSISLSQKRRKIEANPYILLKKTAHWAVSLRVLQAFLARQVHLFKKPVSLVYLISRDTIGPHKNKKKNQLPQDLFLEIWFPNVPLMLFILPWKIVDAVFILQDLSRIQEWLNSWKPNIPSQANRTTRNLQTSWKSYHHKVLDDFT